MSVNWFDVAKVAAIALIFVGAVDLLQIFLLEIKPDPNNYTYGLLWAMWWDIRKNLKQ